MSNKNITEAAATEQPVKTRKKKVVVAEKTETTEAIAKEAHVEVDVATEEVKGEPAGEINTLDAARNAVNSYLNDPEVTNNMRANAEFLEKRFHGNWFTVFQIIKKTSIKDPRQATELMTLMCLKGFASRKLESKDVLKYKITLDAEQRVKILEAQLVELDSQRQALITEIEKLKKK